MSYHGCERLAVNVPRNREDHTVKSDLSVVQWIHKVMGLSSN